MNGFRVTTGYMGIMEKKMETLFYNGVYIGAIVGNRRRQYIGIKKG